MLNSNIALLGRMIFEGYERICRFLMHLEDVEKQFYTNEESIIVDKQPFIKSYEQCLEDLFRMFLHCQKSVGSDIDDRVFYQIFHYLELLHVEINNLQSKWLIHLPRPNEPIELRRFIRVIQKQMTLYYKTTSEQIRPISVYIKEGMGDEIFAVDPLKNYKIEELGFLKEQLKEILETNELDVSESDADSGLGSVHINISRIEANNPFHWPILLHEVSHSLIKSDWFKDDDIANDFIDFLETNEIEFNIESVFENRNQLKGWLIECWCDLFACALMGPAYYYSQHCTFLHSLNFNQNLTHPPYLFRLKLMEKFLNHRFKNLFQEDEVENINSECEDLLGILDKNNRTRFKHGSKLLNLLTYFKEYFLNKFPLVEGKLSFPDVQLNELFNNVDQFVSDISHEKILVLSDRLKQGLPIPSYIINKATSFIEKPNSIQEILYAGWYYRSVIFKDRILEIAKGLSENMNDNAFGNFKDEILKEFQKLDQSMLRSIQVSEWIDLLIEKEETILFQEATAEEVDDEIPRMLVDRDILLHLQKEEIKIIPIVNISKQLGSTSLDIRLGTTFEIYFPNQFGIVDFTKEDAYSKFKNNARRLNLDFIEGIPINPGQFMLCHSLEYIKLPDNVSADLEGRSSFARLGLEIHMTAGFVDPGFEGVLTFEVFNAGINPVMLYPGLRIAQLRFARILKPNKSYSQKHLAKYRGLLEYLPSRQGLDYEVTKIANELKKRRY